MASPAAPLLPHLGATWARDLDGSDAEPAALFARFEQAHADVVWLDSPGGGVHVIGAGRHRLVVDDGVASLDGSPVAGDALDALDAARAALPGPWVGWLGYEAGVRMLGLAPHPSRFPEAAWLLLDTWVVIDDATGRAQLQCRTGATSPPPAAPSLMPSSGAGAVAPVTAVLRDDDAAYAAAIARCTRHILDGDSYLMCLTTALETEPIDAVATYARLRSTSGVRHGGLLRIAGVTLASASPEQFLDVRDGRVRTDPIKGTRRRGQGREDAALVAELRTSAKERAENLMIVDLCRNDLHRVCAPGTVEVTRLFAIETYPAVHQLVSTVEGTLRPGVGVTEVVRATFPAGSMTGAPKLRTVELLSGIEGAARGVYSGCFGVIAGETAHLAMVIRSVVADGDGGHVGVGGGITALSDPASEVDEIHLKAQATLAALVPAPRQAAGASGADRSA